MLLSKYFDIDEKINFTKHDQKILKEFFNNEVNRQLVEENKFDDLYTAFSIHLYDYGCINNVGTLTMFLIKCNINFLDYMKNIPWNFLYSDQFKITFNKVTIPYKKSVENGAIFDSGGFNIKIKEVYIPKDLKENDLGYLHVPEETVVIEY